MESRSRQNKSRSRTEQRKKEPHPYLIAVHLEFAHDLDRDLVVLRGGILGTVYIAEGAIAHLLQQDPALQAGVFRHLGPVHALLCDEPFNLGGALPLGLLLCGFLGRRWAILSGVCGIQIGEIGRVQPLGLWFLLSVDCGNVGGGFCMRRHEAGLFAVADKILDILYGAHI